MAEARYELREVNRRGEEGPATFTTAVRPDGVCVPRLQAESMSVTVRRTRPRTAVSGEAIALLPDWVDLEVERFDLTLVSDGRVVSRLPLPAAGDGWEQTAESRWRYHDPGWGGGVDVVLERNTDANDAALVRWTVEARWVSTAVVPGDIQAAQLSVELFGGVDGMCTGLPTSSIMCVRPGNGVVVLDCASGSDRGVRRGGN